MNKRFVLAWLVLFVFWFLGSFVVHGVLLHDDYAQLPNLMRTEAEAQQYFHFMLLAHVSIAGAFVWMYARGSERRPWLGQGLRFGLVVALLSLVPTYMIYYAVQPTPGALVGKQILFDGIVCLLAGALVAFLYRGHERT
ncbi:MAG TPA: hypothetical protein VI942_02390 [Thermoanaerobaculia bacterium]|nr:hypothetical protein [Thermoanaerobaculia bacterium]